MSMLENRDSRHADMPVVEGTWELVAEVPVPRVTERQLEAAEKRLNWRQVFILRTMRSETYKFLLMHADYAGVSIPEAPRIAEELSERNFRRSYKNWEKELERLCRRVVDLLETLALVDAGTCRRWHL